MDFAINTICLRVWNVGFKKHYHKLELLLEIIFVLLPNDQIQYARFGSNKIQHSIA